MRNIIFIFRIQGKIAYVNVNVTDTILWQGHHDRVMQHELIIFYLASFHFLEHNQVEIAWFCWNEIVLDMDPPYWTSIGITTIEM